MDVAGSARVSALPPRVPAAGSDPGLLGPVVLLEVGARRAGLGGVGGAGGLERDAAVGLFAVLGHDQLAGTDCVPVAQARAVGRVGGLPRRIVVAETRKRHLRRRLTIISGREARNLALGERCNLARIDAARSITFERVWVTVGE